MDHFSFPLLMLPHRHPNNITTTAETRSDIWVTWRVSDSNKRIATHHLWYFWFFVISCWATTNIHLTDWGWVVQWPVCGNCSWHQAAPSSEVRGGTAGESWGHNRSFVGPRVSVCPSDTSQKHGLCSHSELPFSCQSCLLSTNFWLSITLEHSIASSGSLEHSSVHYTYVTEYSYQSYCILRLVVDSIGDMRTIT